MSIPQQSYRAPDVPIEKVTPEFVRDELLRCFESANREFYGILNQPVTDETLRQQVTQFVTGVFRQCGASFESPTKQGILLGMDQCRRNAEAMMGDRGADIIRHHYDEMMSLVTRLPGT
jgi:hypothetical protein